jgi:aminoglycoside phosphotransferase (APT) family kinase protein
MWMDAEQARAVRAARRSERGSGIDAGLVARLVAAQFPQWAGLPIAPVEPGGWDNRTFRLGRELSVRLPSRDWYAEQVDKEHRWLPVLAPHLPLPIPVPVARGVPGEGYPYAWSVYRWLDGGPASTHDVADPTELAVALAEFLVALARVDATDGPSPGPHNFFRGAPVQTYAHEVAGAIAALGDEIPRAAVERVWEDATAASSDREPVWFHGDVDAGNLLVRDGRLAAVIDFGCSGVGDPACDVVIAWTFLSGASRDAFRSALGVDPATWSRGRGWALWKALITLVGALEEDDRAAAGARRREIDRVIADHARDDRGAG